MSINQYLNIRIRIYRKFEVVKSEEYNERMNCKNKKDFLIIS